MGILILEGRTGRPGREEREMANKPNAQGADKPLSEMTREEERAWARSIARGEAAAEEAYEMRAAFGPGQEVVNIFTGKRYHT
jgi:hypothetical protein